MSFPRLEAGGIEDTVIFVTPDMHRVHHSVRTDETSRHFGFNLPWWGYLFRTYTSQPVEGHDGMTIRP